MSLLKFVLSKAVPSPKIESFERFLFVGPHPDDIEIGAGATAAKLADAGKAVCFVIITDGRYGDGFCDYSGDELAAVRRKEALASAKALGVSDVRFLGLCDGANYEIAELEKALARVIGEFKPQVIFAPDPCVTSECHPDHLNSGNAAKKLACLAPYGGIMAVYGADSAPVDAIAFYMTAKPNQFVGTRGFLKAQLNALFVNHTSQFPTESEDAKSIALYLRLRGCGFGLLRKFGTAEGFRVLGVTQMHCFPEAGD